MFVLVDQTDDSATATRLSPKRFSSVCPLKQHLGGKHFADDEDIQHEVLMWMRQQPKEFYTAGIGALIKRWQKCFNTGRDYVEKKLFSSDYHGKLFFSYLL
ncbi:hypothetical protein AVEN_108941-1 [Araneus ventricosus]|uniref:Histone-lysine N-methyltransferase SETMAR n=1 Tax=Araneus ventricosus TaxID=182803 RepID=A0A4Y2QJY4_ARAVE|nr:hypothetical protein AVEN_108941-1 [Araneus ventricosus]